MPLSDEPLLDHEVNAARGCGRPRLRLALLAGALALLVAGGAACHAEVGAWLDGFVRRCAGLGWAAPALLGLMVAALQLLMLPTFPLMVGAGVIFPKMFGACLGQAVGILSVFGGMWLGSMVAFCLGRALFKEWAEEELSKFAWMHVVNAMVEEQGWWVVLLARTSPVLPLEVFNYACSLTSLSACSYAVGCFGSLVPISIWVCSTASATAAIKSAGLDVPPAQKAREFRRHILIVAFNAVFLVAVSAVLLVAVRRYRAKVDHHVDRHVDFHLDRLGSSSEPLACTRGQIKRHVSSSVYSCRRHSDCHHDRVFHLRHTNTI